MPEYIGGFFAVNSDELEWEDGVKTLGLPQGVQIKVLREGYDEVSERTERFVKFPPGYVEPRHEHDHYHSIYVLEGEMHVDGQVLKPGDYVYGGGRGNVHGPYEYPVGCMVFACGRAKKMNSNHSTPE
ncbi:MAG: cupin domain-containing protein [bacterium]